MKHVQLTPDKRCLTWDSGKKQLDLAQVLRVSIGLESRTLQKLYSPSGSGAELDIQPHHWFSLHTATRSFDFGAKDDNQNENELILLWVFTLQQIVAPNIPTDGMASACSALSHAQTQWQRFASHDKEWPCFICTKVNLGQTCSACGSPRPMVTLCPCLMPLLEALQGLGTTLGIRAFDNSPDAHLLWFLLRVLESALPSPFVWSLRHREDRPEELHLGFATADGSFFCVDHPNLVEQQEIVAGLRAQIAAAGGAYQPASPAPFVAPSLDSARGDIPASELDSPLPTGRTDASDTIRIPEGFTQTDFEEGLLAALSISQQQQQQPEQGAPHPPGFEHQSSVQEAPLDAADVFRHCMSGSVDEVRRFLEQGGYADTVYKSAYGWDVGPDWLFTKPNDGTTVLNYVATWTDVIGERAAELVALLLAHGADMQLDDGLDQWFTPLHNAVANGARDVIEVLLQSQPQAVNLPTGDGRRPLHVLALCDDPEDRMASLALLLRHRADLTFAEPFEGNTPLHVMAREGHSEVVIRLLEAGAPADARNEKGHTALDEANHELQIAEQEGDAATATRQSKLSETVMLMEIAVLASCFELRSDKRLKVGQLSPLST